MKNNIGNLALDSVAETAQVTNDISGLSTLSVLLSKLEARVGYVIRSERLAAARAQIAAKEAEIKNNDGGRA